jgi:4-hydroxy-tetrahydrodipicolinate synthase
MEKIVHALPGFAVLAGADPLMRPLLEIGGAGCITATSNLAGAELAKVFHCYSDPARKAEVDVAQARIVKLREIAGRFVQIPAVKAMLARRYRDPAWRRVRPPLMPLGSAELTELDRLVSKIG